MERRNSEPFVEPNFVVHAPNYGNDMLIQLNLLREELLFTDATLCVQDQQFHCHRNILAVSSVYFRAMFSSGLREGRECKVVLNDISASTVKCMLDYVYTGRIEINIDNAQELLSAATLYTYPTLVDACCELLKRHLHPSNTLGIEHYAHLHSCTVLHNTAHQYALDNFSAVVDHEEFLNLPFLKVKEYISSDHIDVQKEETVYKAAIDWVRHDECSRQRYLGQIIECIRLPIIEVGYLESIVAKDPLIILNDECLQMIHNAKKYHETKTDQHGRRRVSMQDQSVLPRPSTMAKEVIVVVGGVNDYGRSTVEMYEPHKNKWLPLPDMPTDTTGFAVTAMGNNVYVCGGIFKGTITNRVFKFDTAKRKWSIVPSMLLPRTGHASASLDDHLYVLGGYTIVDSKIVSVEQIESYDAISNEWTAVGICPFPRKHSQLVPYNETLIEVGGRQGGVRVYTIECYLCNSSQCTYSGEQFVLPNVIEQSKIIVLDGLFYIIWEDTRKMISLDPVLRTFRFLADMNHTHLHSGATIIGDNIYVIGGLVDGKPSNIVERYSPATNTWSNVKSLPAPRAGLGCVTVQM